MRFLFYYFFFRMFLGNPLLALFIIVIIYLIIDQKFIGLFPDIFSPFKRKSRINSLKEEVRLNPANANAYKELGQLYLETKKYQESIGYFEKTLDKMGDYADNRFYLGKAYYLNGQKEKGQEQLTKALEINTKVGYGEPYIYLLDNLLSQGGDKLEINNMIENIHRFGTPEILYKAGDTLLKYGDSRGKDLLKEAVENYRGIPGNFKKIHRRWVFLARIKLIGK
ncbi:MAG: tetratricopeptide repeat protein [Bacillota bacterium]